MTREDDRARIPHKALDHHRSQANYAWALVRPNHCLKRSMIRAETALRKVTHSTHRKPLPVL